MEPPDAESPDCEVGEQYSREAFDALLDAVRQPLLVLDVGLCVVAANRAFQDRFAPDGIGVVGQHLRELCDGRWNISELHALVLDVVQGHRQLGDLQLAAPVPEVGPVRIDARRLGNADQVLLSVEPVDSGDAPSRSEASLDREHGAMEHIDDFLSILGHELRSPLMAIHNVSSLLSGDRSPEPERRDELYRILARQTAHVMRLIDDLLDFSRVNAGMLSLQRVDVALRECVVSAVNSLESRAEKAGIHLSVDLPAGDVHVNADPVRITQVVTNLLDNAIKYNHSGGNVWLSLRREDDDAVLRVRDDGIGIEAAAMESIFQVFTRVENRTRGQKGLGLGLALVHQFVKLHGGDLEVHSDGPGHGCEFAVRLPAIEGPAAAPEPAAAWPQRGSRRILLVDDNADSVDTLAGLLELSGHQVRTAYNGADALRLVPGFEPDVILLDIGMPDMDGFEVARRLREGGHLNGVRLIALTGYGLTRDQHEIDEVGFDLHVLKPVRPDDLEAALYGDG